jgi:hypothetical protein
MLPETGSWGLPQTFIFYWYPHVTLLYSNNSKFNFTVPPPQKNLSICPLSLSECNGALRRSRKASRLFRTSLALQLYVTVIVNILFHVCEEHIALMPTDSAYIKPVGFNLQVSHRLRVFNFRLTVFHMCRHIYDLSSYEISHTNLQWFISYRRQTESWRQLSHCRHTVILHPAEDFLEKSCIISED